MARKIFVNLPVSDVAKSTTFYRAIGGSLNPQFSNAETSSMVFSEDVTVMLLSHARFSDFAPRPIADARSATAVLLAFSEDSRAGVDATIEAGVAAGGRGDPSPSQDHGFMYGRSLEDPDGHVLEFMWLDLAAMNAAMSASTPAATGDAQ